MEVLINYFEKVSIRIPSEIRRTKSIRQDFITYNTICKNLIKKYEDEVIKLVNTYDVVKLRELTDMSKEMMKPLL